jgi:predicted aconitase
MNDAPDPEIITIGCPHASLEEIKEVADLLKLGKVIRKVWVFTSRETLGAAKQKGLIDIIEKAGGSVFADTCMVVSPLYEMGIRSVGVNSGKAAKYLPSFNKQKIRYAPVELLIKTKKGRDSK